MYLIKSVSDDVRMLQMTYRKYPRSKRLVIGAFLACMATILQAAGGYLPGIGYMISPLATFPILMGAMFSIRVAAMSYILTILLLLLLAPSELFVFPFTTGLLGLGIGIGFSFFQKRVTIILVGAASLTSGILSLLYFFHFPILGPVVTHSFSILTVGSIFIFSFFYSLIWMEFAFYFFKKMRASYRE